MKMELKDALELVQSDWEHHADTKYREAARLLREGSVKVEHVDEFCHPSCAACEGGIGRTSPHYKYRKTYTTHHELEIIEVTSEPTFVEIGGSDE